MPVVVEASAARAAALPGATALAVNIRRARETWVRLSAAVDAAVCARLLPADCEWLGSETVPQTTGADSSETATEQVAKPAIYSADEVFLLWGGCARAWLRISARGYVCLRACTCCNYVHVRVHVHVCVCVCGSVRLHAGCNSVRYLEYVWAWLRKAG